MNEATNLDVNVLLPMLGYSMKQSWEQTRLVSYITAAVQPLKKKIKMKDIISFSWDKEEDMDDADNTENNTPMTEEIMEKLENQSKAIIKQLNKGQQ